VSSVTSKKERELPRFHRFAPKSSNLNVPAPLKRRHLGAFYWYFSLIKAEFCPWYTIVERLEVMRERYCRIAFGVLTVATVCLSFVLVRCYPAIGLRAS